jgi:hypothetical protein
LWFEGSLGKQFVRTYLEKNPSQKKGAGRVARGVGPEFKPQYRKKKKKKVPRHIYIPEYQTYITSSRNRYKIVLSV